MVKGEPPVGDSQKGEYPSVNIADNKELNIRSTRILYSLIWRIVFQVDSEENKNKIDKTKMSKSV